MADDASKWADKRRFPRVRLDVAIQAIMSRADGADSFVATVSMLGAGGAFVSTAALLDKGDRVSMHFELPTDPSIAVFCDAEVRYLLYGKGVGVQFLDLEADLTNGLTAFVNRQLDDGQAAG